MLKKVYFSLAFFLFALALFLGLDRMCHRPFKHSFPSHVRSSNLFSSQWKTPTLSTEEKQRLLQILNQKFVLYDRGSHSYVCLSEDGKYILKFLKQQRLDTKSWLSHFTFSFNPYYQEFAFRKKRTEVILDAWKTAFTEFKQETGLIYLHANNAQSLHHKVRILDNDGIEHSIDLDKTIFCVQHHARLIYLRIADLMQHRDIAGAKRVLNSIFSLIYRLQEKGVIGGDYPFECNFGLVQDRAIQVDLSKLRVNAALGLKRSCGENIAGMTEHLRTWLEKSYPELMPHFESCLASPCQELLKTPD